jgi:hypothetical protein
MFTCNCSGAAVPLRDKCGCEFYDTKVLNQYLWMVAPGHNLWCDGTTCWILMPHSPGLGGHHKNNPIAEHTVAVLRLAQL